MPAPRLLPDNDVLINLRDHHHMSYQEIADRYGVTKGAVYLRMKQANHTRPRPDHGAAPPMDGSRSNTSITWPLNVCA